MNDGFFSELFEEFLNGGCPVNGPALAGWHEIKAWAEDLLRPAG